MSRVVRITPFAVTDEPVALVWLHDLHLDRNGDWALIAVLRGLRGGGLFRAEVPFGMVPLLAPGRVYTDGIRSEAAARIGEVGRAFIASLRDAETARLSEVPPELFPDGRPRGSDQKLLLYRTPGLDLYIPPLELVRRLFLHDRVLANVILRHGGLTDLWVPVMPGFPEELLLEFTAAMPQRVLTEDFVREFAWLAVHPTGAASWNSVSRLSNPADGIMLRLPKLGGFEMTFRGLFGGGAALVHEILSLPGKVQRFRQLDYTHPALKENAPRAALAAHALPDGDPRRPSQRFEKDFNVKGEASRRRGDADTADVPRPGSDFAERHGTVRRRPIARSPRSGDGAGAGSASWAEDASSEDPPQRRVVEVTVSDISTSPRLPPLSFRILRLASPDYIGDLGPLLDTLRRMREMLPPTTTVASSLCAMPLPSPLAWVGRQRRPCLVAVFSPAGRPPVALLDVDHSGLESLSAVALQAWQPTTPEDLEKQIAAVLSLVESGGRWPADLEQSGGRDFTVQRIKRMLRLRPRVESADYQTKWAAMLVDRLGLG